MQIGVETSRAVENKRVYVVHSDEIFRAALQFMLHDENEAHEVTSLQEAYAKSADRKVDLILLDMSIVRSGGASVLREIAQRIPGAKVLLVAETANDPLAIACLGSGANDVLALPLKVEAVRRKANALLGRGATPVSLKVLG